MKIFGIGDLHLSFCQRVVPGKWENVVQHKPMDIFGLHWQNHFQKIYDHWVDRVNSDDMILVPGDISWGMTLQDAAFDLEFLGSLPGKILMVQGNHDYWWSGITKVRRALPSNVTALQNDSFLLENMAVCGTRGWVCPHSPEFTGHDEKIYLREVQRLELSLRSVPSQVKRIIVMMHFMPVNDAHEHNEFIRLMERYGVELCIYGHLHQGAYHMRLPADKWGIKFFLVSADYLNFQPKLLWDQCTIN